MRLKLSAVLMVLPALAIAQSCPAVDYVEAKDWTVEAVERAYCADYEIAYALLVKQNEALKRSLSSALAYDPYLARCNNQMDLYARILQNRFNRKPPSCKPPS